MAHLNIIGLTCQKKPAAKDELRLKIRWNARDDLEPEEDIWETRNIEDGEAKSINREYDFVTYVQLVMYEKNRRTNPHFMGAFMLTSKDAGQGEQTRLFSRRRGKYTLTFVVSRNRK